MTTDDDTPPAPSRMNWGDEIRKIREGQGLSQRRPGQARRRKSSARANKHWLFGPSDKRWSTK